MANRPPAERLAHAYMDAKEAVLAAGFANEVDWQDGLRACDLTESAFLREYAWVVFSSGFRETVLRAKFPALCQAFGEFSSARNIWSHRARCRRQALSVFGHRGKVEAVLECSRVICAEGFDAMRPDLTCRGVEFIRELPYMGPITSLHLAKNIGLEVVKPDRHLVRIAEHCGYGSPLEMCAAIRDLVGDALSVIDVVIWRYATIEPAAPENFSVMCGGGR
jgi:hypothetical protein